MTSRRSIVLLAVALALLPAGCQTGRELRGGSFERRTAEAGEVTFLVTNMAFADATLYAIISGGGRRLLGRVTGKREATLTMALAYSTNVQVEIDLLAGPTCYTNSVSLNPGDRIELVIQIDGPNIRCNSYSPGSS